GNSGANGGTYLGINEPASGAGSAADFLNFQNNGTSKLQVTSAGNITAAGTLSLGTASTTTGSISFKNATNSNTLTLQAGATGSNLTFTLPTADGGRGTCLRANGSAVLSFQSCAASGSGVTSLDALTGALTINNSSGAGSTVTINNAKADASTKGIATF